MARAATEAETRIGSQAEPARRGEHEVLATPRAPCRRSSQGLAAAGRGAAVSRHGGQQHDQGRRIAAELRGAYDDGLADVHAEGRLDQGLPGAWRGRRRGLRGGGGRAGALDDRGAEDEVLDQELAGLRVADPGEEQLGAVRGVPVYDEMSFGAGRGAQPGDVEQAVARVRQEILQVLERLLGGLGQLGGHAAGTLVRGEQGELEALRAGYVGADQRSGQLLVRRGVGAQVEVAALPTDAALLARALVPGQLLGGVPVEEMDTVARRVGRGPGGARER